MWMMSRLAVIADTGGDRQRGRQVTGLVGMESTGRLLGPAVGGLLAAGWDVRVPFIVHGVLSLLAIAPSFKLVKETAPNRTRAGGAHGPTGAEGDTGRLRDLLIAPVLMFFLAQVLASFTRGSLHSGIPHLYAVYQYGVGPETIGFLAATAGALGIPIILTSGHLMDRFGRTFTVVPGFILLGLGLFIMAGTALAELPFAAYAATFYFVQMAQGLTAGNMQVIGSDIAPPHLRGRFFGIWRLMGEIGVASSPAVFGVVAEHFGYAPPFAILGVTAWLSAVILGTQVRGMLKRKGLTGSAREVAAGT
jgi:MFS family permease